MRFNVLLFSILSVAASLISTRSAFAQSGCVESANFANVSPGQSVVGLGVLHPLLNIETSGGNDVVALAELTYPVAYGANTGGINNVANACLGRGFADVGSGTYALDTKKHEY